MVRELLLRVGECAERFERALSPLRPARRDQRAERLPIPKSAVWGDYWPTSSQDILVEHHKTVVWLLLVLLPVRQQRAGVVHAIFPEHVASQVLHLCEGV